MNAYLPSLLALLAAFMFALAAHIQNIGLNRTNGQIASLVIVLTTAGLFWIIAPLILNPAHFLTSAALLFAFSGLLRPTISVSLWTHGIRLLGPTLTSGLGASGPIFAALFAFLLLGEVMTLPVAIGTLLVIAGILVATLRGKASKADWPLWAISLPMGAELCRAIAHSFTKIGFDEVNDPFFAGLMATTTAAVLLTARYVAQGQRLDFRASGNVWFVICGLFSGGGILVLNVALQLGQVITVVPIVSTTPLFAMLLGLLIFGREKLTWQTFVTIGLIVPGVMLVSLSQ